MKHQGPHSVYQLGNYAQRVNYAAHCIQHRQGTDTRAFDTCFEMFDGAAVVVALLRRAESNDALAVSIREWCGGGYPAWQATAARYAAVPTQRLGALASLLRTGKGAHVEPSTVSVVSVDETLPLSFADVAAPSFAE